MEGRRWEDLDEDRLLNVLGRVGMESLILDVHFVSKSWHRAKFRSIYLGKTCFSFLLQVHVT